MRIVGISDTHERNLGEIPDGDVLVHCGDFSIRRDTMLSLELLNEEFKKLPHKYKILVPGNHDWCFEDNYEEACKVFTEGTVLINRSIEIEGIKFYGTPDQPIFYNWAFNKTAEELIKSYSKIPEGTDVLITHTPPLWILDEVSRGHVGSEELYNRVLEINPKLHIFGHIHEGYGITEINDITFINAAICDEWYSPVNEPIVFDI